MRTGRPGVTGTIRICGLMLALMLSISLFAQNRQGRTNTNAGSAVLHIQVNVMPTVLSPTPQRQTTQTAPISYIIPIVNQQDQTTVQETAIAPLSATCTTATCSGIVRTTTVVAH